jgi:hypothetical protein
MLSYPQVVNGVAWPKDVAECRLESLQGDSVGKVNIFGSDRIVKSQKGNDLMYTAAEA